MRELDAQAVAAEWIERWSHDPPTLPKQLASDLDSGLPRSQPRVALDAIVAVLRCIPADPANRLFQVLAAGPLENLLNWQGEACLDEVELLARRDPAFRLLLNGVWSRGAPPVVVERLAKYRTAPW